MNANVMIVMAMGMMAMGMMAMGMMAMGGNWGYLVHRGIFGPLSENLFQTFFSYWKTDKK